ncbi:FusB/FusC family EF-G-binding protein [Rossellomorea aquimaris]|uniref:Elongation factor G-binding protein n=1 Tax=Rossellomorea aquimaris TaxID=189382 RepID=A0A5D4T9V6_9BACI|nr:FusB/FusC family EF-G-binding protein [Rossellomorea aquimaris]TYS71681.1 elongation factor G-binding protein [Rossellomorea aquimaris]
MKPFIRNDQFNFIKAQTKVLINGHVNANDPGVMKALKAVTLEKVLSLLPAPSEEEHDLLSSIASIKDKQDAENYLAKLKPFVIPFREVSDKTLQKLFPKVKKLKLPNLENVDLREVTYLGWNDIGQERKYLVTEDNGKLIGMRGTFKNHSQKGVCTICNSIGEIGMFITESKAAANGTYRNRGNYICQDSQACNRSLQSEEKLNAFIQHLQNR